MSWLPSLPAQTNLADVLRQFPNGWIPLLEAHDLLLRAESPLSIGERELIAAYVSGLNGCEFCWNAHRSYAEGYGVPSDVADSLRGPPGEMRVEAKLKPILAYVEKLTLNPEAVTSMDVASILEAGWPERAVADSAMVAALFNFMNRIVLGLGVAPFETYYARRLAEVRSRPQSERLAANDSDLGQAHYRGYGRHLGIERDGN